MFNIDNWQEIFHSIKENKLRTFISGFCVAIGIFVFIILVGFGQGFQNGIQGQFSGAANSIWVWGGVTSQPAFGMQAGRQIIFNNDDRNDFTENVNGTGIISSIKNVFGTNYASYGSKTSSFPIRAVEEDFNVVRQNDIYAGRFINKTDVVDKRKVAVLGQKVKNILFPKESAVGKYIKISGIPFKVVGVFDNPDNRWEPKRIYIPISTQQIAFSGGTEISAMVVTVKDGTKSSAAKMVSEMKDYFAQRHRFRPQDNSAINVENVQEEYTMWMNVFNGIKIVLGFFGILTLIAGIVGVGNIMLIVAKERKREIGLRKALGAKRGSIIKLFLMEAGFITIISGYIGLFAGVMFLRKGALTYIMLENGFPEDFFSQPNVSNSVAITATIVLICAGILAGYFPALNAAKISPIEALKDE